MPCSLRLSIGPRKSWAEMPCGPAEIQEPRGHPARTRQCQASNPSPAPSFCVALGELHNLSVPWLPPLSNVNYKVVRGLSNSHQHLKQLPP